MIDDSIDFATISILRYYNRKVFVSGIVLDDCIQRLSQILRSIRTNNQQYRVRAQYLINLYESDRFNYGSISQSTAITYSIRADDVKMLRLLNE